MIFSNHANPKDNEGRKGEEGVPGTNISEIVDDPKAALEQFRLIANDLGEKGA